MSNPPVLRLVRVACASLAVLVASAAGPAAATAESQAPPPRSTHFPLGEHGDLVLNVPSGWRLQSAKPATSVPSALIRMRAPSGEMVMLTAVPDSRADKRVALADTLKARTAQAGKEMLGSSQETELRLEELTGRQGSGSYYTLTDKSLVGVETLPEGEYRTMTQGALAIGDLALVFTILTNDKSAPVRMEALRMLSGAMQLH
jgi:hypothetical protein